MENYILYFCAYFIEAVILWQYCTAIFQPKSSVFTRVISLTIMYGILSVIFVLNLININVALFFFSNFIYIYFMFHSGLFSALFHSALTTTIMVLSELLVSTLFPNIVFNFYESSNYQQIFVINMILSKFIYFFLLFFISHLLAKNKERILPNKREILFILLIPILSIFVTLTLFVICIEIILSASLSRMILVSSFLLLIINIITWIIYSYTQRKNLEFTTLQLQLQKEQDTAEYNKMLLKQNENQQILIHDIRKHLSSISLLNEQGESEKITAYIHQLVNSSDLQSTVRMCDHELLNMILSRYSRQCVEARISFHTDIRSGLVEFMSENDLTSLFCNLLDNSVEAARHYPDGFIDLMVSKRSEGAMTLITLINSCRINPFDKYGKLVSKKGDPLHHGFGLRSIERITKCYGGEMKQYYNAEDYTFHTIILLMRPKK